MLISVSQNKQKVSNIELNRIQKSVKKKPS